MTSALHRPAWVTAPHCRALGHGGQDTLGPRVNNLCCSPPAPPVAPCPSAKGSGLKPACPPLARQAQPEAPTAQGKSPEPAEPRTRCCCRGGHELSWACREREEQPRAGRAAGAQRRAVVPSVPHTSSSLGRASPGAVTGSSRLGAAAPALTLRSHNEALESFPKNSRGLSPSRPEPGGTGGVQDPLPPGREAAPQEGSHVLCPRPAGVRARLGLAQASPSAALGPGPIALKRPFTLSMT